MYFAGLATLLFLTFTGTPSGITSAPDVRVESFVECEAAGFPVMESFPRQCRAADGQLFVEEVAPVVDGCGDGFCAELTCQAIGCPLPETPQSCPEDCQ